jgi:acyl-CoA reductase-like NAD-dependent aldehyde dehydrogenase
MPVSIARTVPFLLAGESAECGSRVTIANPYNGELLGEVAQANAEAAEIASKAAAKASIKTSRLASWQRAQILNGIAEELLREKDGIARGVSLEAGKPIVDARSEVDRAVETFRIAAEEARRIEGGLLPLDWTPGTEGRMGLRRRFAIGPVLGITPFNFPLNLVAHKVAPALAAGNPIIIKPSPQTPFTALRLGEIVVQAGWPKDGISVLPCSNEVAEWLVTDPNLRMLSFTGSAAVGWQLRKIAGKKRVTLELGGNAAVLVAADADLDLAAERIVKGGFTYSGQSCISVQRVFADAAIAETMRQRLRQRIAMLKVGDPIEESTEIGPMINENAAKRLESWIGEAVNAGAQLEIGGHRERTLIEPALLSEVPDTVSLAQEEAFGPVIYVNAYTSFEEALQRVNQSRYGLQAAIFTQRWDLMTSAWNRLEVGALLVNESTAWRADHMPYGGVKESGIGREGVRSAIEDMTEERMLIVRA